MVNPNPANRATVAKVLSSQWFNPVATLEDARALFLQRNLQILNLGAGTDPFHHQTTEA